MDVLGQRELMNRISYPIEENPKSRLGKLIGKGQCSEVYVWEDSKVCKLFYDFMSQSNLEREYSAGLAALSAGLPVAGAYGIVQIENRFGIIFDRLDGKDIETKFRLRPWKLKIYMKEFTELQNKMHAVSAPYGLFSQHEQLEEWISRSTPVSKQIRDTAVKELRGLPEGYQLCHGDFHFQNVLLSTNGLSIIDWQTGNAGHPLADVAATEIIQLVPINPAILFHVVLPLHRKRAALYRQSYKQMSWFNEEEYRIRFFIATVARIGNVLHNRLAVRLLLKTVDSLYNKILKPTA